MGAFVATTASPAGKALVTRLGADLVIDYREEDFWKVLAGYDCLYDVFGGKSLDEGFKILRRGGRIVSLNGTPNARFGKVQHLGFLKTTALRVASIPLTLREKRYGVTYDMIFVRPDSHQLDILRGLYEEGRIVPVIDKVFPLGEAQKALDYSQSGRAKGKIALKVCAEDSTLRPDAACEGDGGEPQGARAEERSGGHVGGVVHVQIQA